MDYLQRRHTWFLTLAKDTSLGQEALRVMLVLLAHIGDGWTAMISLTEVGRVLGRKRFGVALSANMHVDTPSCIHAYLQPS